MRGRRIRTGWVLGALLAAISLACSTCKDETVWAPPPVEKNGVSEVRLAMGGVEVALEVAADKEKRELGLMRRRHLKPDRGMIFIYPEPRVMSFWMKDTWIPLSIAFLREDGTVVNIEEMKPMVASPSYVSQGLCRFAIEMNRGWFEAHGIKPGDRIVLPPELYQISAEPGPPLEQEE
jgi:uncharacterized membrane protein (UPF0127 family)